MHEAEEHVDAAYVMPKAMLAAMVIAMPPGPVLAGLLGISARRPGRFPGPATVAAAAADTIHACLATLGAGSLFGAPGGWVRLLAACVLALAALRCMLGRRAVAGPRAIAELFLLALLSPGTLAAFSVVFPLLGVAGVHALPAACAGACAGSLLWWTGVALLGRRLSPCRARLDYVTAALLIAAAVGTFA